MKRIFAIGDTHRLMIIPPAGYDYTIHLGDFIDYFDVGLNDEKLEIYRHRFDEIRQAYTHYVIGNHERMFLNRYGPNILGEEMPESLTIPVEGIKLRASHYINQPRRGSRELPLVPESLMQNMFREVIKCDARLVLYGHTHRQRYDQYQGFHLVDVGHGQRGDAADIVVDGRHVEVNLLPDSRGNG